jgi:hypothetical protein
MTTSISVKNQLQERIKGRTLAKEKEDIFKK